MVSDLFGSPHQNNYCCTNFAKIKIQSHFWTFCARLQIEGSSLIFTKSQQIVICIFYPNHVILLLRTLLLAWVCVSTEFVVFQSPENKGFKNFQICSLTLTLVFGQDWPGPLGLQEAGPGCQVGGGHCKTPWTGILQTKPQHNQRSSEIYRTRMQNQKEKKQRHPLHYSPDEPSEEECLILLFNFAVHTCIQWTMLVMP